MINFLIIDDNTLNIKLMRSILETSGNYRVTAVTTAEAGLEKLESETPDLILMDIQLPGMSGYEATQIIKADERLKDIPVIAVTSYATQTDKEIAYQSGCDDYITKPIMIEQFKMRIREWIGTPSRSNE